MVTTNPFAPKPFKLDGSPAEIETFQIVCAFGFAAFGAGSFASDIEVRLPQSANIWDTDQGVAKGYAKFTPTQEGWAVFNEVGITSAYSGISPLTEAEATFDLHTASFGYNNQFELSANGYAPIHTKNGLVGYFRTVPAADSVLRVKPTVFNHRYYNVSPFAAAYPTIEQLPAMTADQGFVIPWGVKNLNDDELIALILETRRKRRLTQHSKNGITRA